MSELKYKAVKELNLCKGCINRGTVSYKQKYCVDFVNKIVRLGLSNCNCDDIIYQLDTETDTSTITLEQAKEKAKENFHKTDDGKYYLRRLGDAGLDHSRYFSDLEKYANGYIQALKDFGILE